MKNTIRHLRDILKVRYFINTSKEEKQFKTTINRYLNAWKSETIKKFNNKIEKNLIKKDIDPKDIEAIANFKIGSIDKRLASLGVAAAQKGLERAYLDMNTILSWDIDMTPIADYYLQHYKEFTNVVTKDIQDRIRNIISDGVKEGKTNETLSKEISDTFDNPIIVTVPDNYHTTLDELGYGPYSSITYAKPDFEKVNKQEADNFFNTTVNNWIKSKETKWAGRFENNVIEITPTIITANTWQRVHWDISVVTDVNKDAIDKIVITIVNADSANTFYIDYLEIAQAIDVVGMVG